MDKEHYEPVRICDKQDNGYITNPVGLSPKLQLDLLSSHNIPCYDIDDYGQSIIDFKQYKCAFNNLADLLKCMPDALLQQLISHGYGVFKVVGKTIKGKYQSIFLPEDVIYQDITQEFI